MNPLKIKLGIGIIKLTHDKEYLPKSPCYHCKEDVFWVKLVSGMKKIAISKENNMYIDHSLVCPILTERENIKARKKRHKLKKKKK